MNNVDQQLRLEQAQIFRTPRLAAACEFLCDQHVYGAGWPQYPGGPVTFYHTALVVSALSATDYSQYGPRVKQVVKSVLAPKLESLVELKLHDLTNLLIICLAAPEAIAKCNIDRVCAELRKQIERECNAPERIRIREFAGSIAALAQASPDNREAINTWGEQLLRVENLQRGGWPGNQNGEPSVLATAAVIQALQAINPDKYSSSIQRGLRFLSAVTASEGWQQIGHGPDVFVQATVLRVLAASGSFDNVDAGIAALDESDNDTGGWGVAPGTPSAIEPTAAAVLALVACGENRVVPFRFAAAHVADATRRVSELEAQLAEAQREIEEGNARRNKRIIAQRDAFQVKATNLERELVRLREDSQTAQRAALEEANRTRALVHYVALQDPLSQDTWKSLELVIPIGFVLLAAVFWFFGPSIGSLAHADPVKLLAFGAALYGLLTFASHQMRIRITRRNTFRRMRSIDSMMQMTEGPISSAVLAFADIASRLPAGVREELTYLISSRVADMPPAIGTEYVRDMANSLGLPPPVVGEIVTWLPAFLSLDPYSRRAVAEQIRRQLHAS